jgi:hypothetical protein
MFCHLTTTRTASDFHRAEPPLTSHDSDSDKIATVKPACGIGEASATTRCGECRQMAINGRQRSRPAIAIRADNPYRWGHPDRRCLLTTLGDRVAPPQTNRNGNSIPYDASGPACWGRAAIETGVSVHGAAGHDDRTARQTLQNLVLSLRNVLNQGAGSADSSQIETVPDFGDRYRSPGR